MVAVSWGVFEGGGGGRGGVREVEAGLDSHLAVGVELQQGVSGVGCLADAGGDGVGVGGDRAWVRVDEEVCANKRLCRAFLADEVVELGLLLTNNASAEGG